MNFSRLALEIVSSPTLSLNEMAKNLQANGKPVINLGVGEPLNLAPISAIDIASNRLKSRFIKYSPSSGVSKLKNTICQYTHENYGVMPTKKNVLVTVGAKQAIFNTLFSILNRDDEVILLAPYWVSYPEMIKMASGKPVVIMPKKDTLEPSINDIKAAVSSRTKAIILNNPNNPSGIVYSSEFVGDLVKYCEKEEIFLIMDDIYHKLVFGERSWVSGYHFTNKNIDNSYIVIINGISKTYGMTGFRIGWAIGPAVLICIMTNIQSQTTSGASILLQDAALGALTGSQSEVNELCSIIKSNKDITLKGLMNIPKLNLIEPGGAFYCLPDFSAYNPDSMALSEFILKKALVALVPGVAFGMEGHLRISFAGNPEDIKEAIQRIHWVLDKSTGEEIQMGGQIYKRDW
jgi:aspartate aminotransferase